MAERDKKTGRFLPANKKPKEGHGPECICPNCQTKYNHDTGDIKGRKKQPAKKPDAKTPAPAKTAGDDYGNDFFCGRLTVNLGGSDGGE